MFVRSQTTYHHKTLTRTPAICPLLCSGPVFGLCFLELAPFLTLQSWSRLFLAGATNAGQVRPPKFCYHCIPSSSLSLETPTRAAGVASLYAHGRIGILLCIDSSVHPMASNGLGDASEETVDFHSLHAVCQKTFIFTPATPRVH